MLIWIPDRPQVSADRAGMYHIPVIIQGSTHRTHQAFLDSWCNQTSVHQSLIRGIGKCTIGEGEVCAWGYS